MINEIWKDIPGYEGYYQVSNYGRIKSLSRPVYRKRGGGFIIKKETILKDVNNWKGYRGIYLQKDGVIKRYRVHRLVALCFVPNPHSYSQINHKDENKANNRADNLEWCTASYNDAYGTRVKRVGIANTNGKMSRPVRQLTLNGNEVARYPSLSEVRRQFGWNISHIGKICRGFNGTAYGYKWEYIDD